MKAKTLKKCSTVLLRDLVCMTKEEATRHEKEIFKAGKAVSDVYETWKRFNALKRNWLMLPSTNSTGDLFTWLWVRIRMFE